MQPGDLTSLANLKQYLTGIGTVTDDSVLQALVSAASGVVTNYVNRDFRPLTRTEVRDGPDSCTLAMMQWPINLVTSVTVNGNVVPKSPDGISTAGWTNDDKFVYLVGASSFYPVPSRSGAYKFFRGYRNVSVVYNAGYLVGASLPDNFLTFPVEAAVIPATPFQVFPQRTAISDAGVTYANGTPLTAIFSGTPTIAQYLFGQITTGSDAGKVGYQFAAADTGASVRLSYGYCPTDVELAVWDVAANQYKRRGRIGEKSKSLAGEVVSFDVSLISDSAKATLDNYKRRVMA